MELISISIARKQILKSTSINIFHRQFLKDLTSFADFFFFFSLNLNEFSFWLHMLFWEILQNACSDRIFFYMSYYMLLWVSTEKTYFNSHFQTLSWEGELPSSFKVTGFDGWEVLTEIPVSLQIERKTEKKISLSQLRWNEAKSRWPFNNSTLSS